MARLAKQVVEVLGYNCTIMSQLNMELDLQSLFGFHVYSCTHSLRPRNAPPPPPAFGLIYEGDTGRPR